MSRRARRDVPCRSRASAEPARSAERSGASDHRDACARRRRRGCTRTTKSAVRRRPRSHPSVARLWYVRGSGPPLRRCATYQSAHGCSGSRAWHGGCDPTLVRPCARPVPARPRRECPRPPALASSACRTTPSTRCPTASCSPGPDGRVLVTNAMARRMLGITEDLTGMPLMAVLALSDHDGNGWVESNDPYGGLTHPDRRARAVLAAARRHRGAGRGPAAPRGRAADRSRPSPSASARAAAGPASTGSGPTWSPPSPTSCARRSPASAASCTRSSTAGTSSTTSRRS